MRAPLETVPDPDGLYRGEHTEPYRGSNVWRAHREEMIAEIPHLREKARKFGLTFDTPAPPPPATDPQGWVPLVRGGKLPEKDSYPLVTLLDETLGQRRTLSAHYLPNSFAVGSRVYLGPDFDTFVYAAGHNGTHKGLRLLAWRPAPAPYRGGV